MCASQNDGFLKAIKTRVAMKSSRQKLVCMLKMCIYNSIALIKDPNYSKSKDYKPNVNLTYILWGTVFDFHHIFFKW